MNRQEEVALAGHLGEPDQPVTHVSRGMDEGMRKTERLAEEWAERNRFSQGRNGLGHASIAGERIVRLSQRDQILH